MHEESSTETTAATSSSIYFSYHGRVFSVKMTLETTEGWHLGSGWSLYGPWVTSCPPPLYTFKKGLPFLSQKRLSHQRRLMVRVRKHNSLPDSIWLDSTLEQWLSTGGPRATSGTPAAYHLAPRAISIFLGRENMMWHDWWNLCT